MIWFNSRQIMKFYIRTRTTCSPLRDENRIFTNLYGRHDWHLVAAVDRGDWHKTDAVLQKGPNWIINQIEKSGLRGRGGAGFFTGQKLRFMQSTTAPRPAYLVINGAEGEPGTCKDREILRHEPHKILEGALIIGRAVNAKAAIVFIRGEFYNEACTLQTAVAEAYEAGLLGSNACGSGFDFDVFVQRGAGEYVCGEETALINCLMGIEGRPHRKPPYPSEKGIYDKSTTVLNVETISVTPTICRRGSSWFAALGCKPHSTGTKIFNISGHVERPCTVEEQMGVSLRELIEKHCGGVRGGWHNLLAVIPGGTSTSLIPAGQCNDLTLDYQSLKEAKSSVGTGAVIVIDKSTDILKVMERTLSFFWKESCHQCSKCRKASIWDYEYASRFEVGNGQPREIDWLWAISKWADGDTICAFANANAYAVYGFIRHFRTEMEQRMRKYANS